MSVNDPHRREIATSEFLTRALGAKLTENARALMEGLGNGDFAGANGPAIAFASGSIAERVLWQAAGAQIGYFDSVAPVSESEKEFLAEHLGSLEELGLPDWIEEVCTRLVHSDSATDIRFYESFLRLPLTRLMPEWFPVFQAALVASEPLNYGPITSFFLFLDRGSLDEFKKQTPDPNAVFSHLRDEDFVANFQSDLMRPEPILAGFIRFTQVLSTLDAIFPDIALETLSETEEALPIRTVDRDILFTLLTQFRWRFPAKGSERWQAVLFAFLELTGREFSKNPLMGIQWSYIETFSTVVRLSRKFFFGFGQNDLDGEEDPTREDERRRWRRAVDERIAFLRAQGSDGLAAVTS
jgi:hypothetical protein